MAAAAKQAAEEAKEAASRPREMGLTGSVPQRIGR
jgi:hypothetical protein